MTIVGSASGRQKIGASKAVWLGSLAKSQAPTFEELRFAPVVGLLADYQAIVLLVLRIPSQELPGNVCRTEIAHILVRRRGSPVAGRHGANSTQGHAYPAWLGSDDCTQREQAGVIGTRTGDADRRSVPHRVQKLQVAVFGYPAGSGEVAMMDPLSPFAVSHGVKAKDDSSHLLPLSPFRSRIQEPKIRR
jgi:hypothetical protein